MHTGDENSAKDRDPSTASSQEQIHSAIHLLSKHFNIDHSEISDFLKSNAQPEEIRIPTSIFNSKISSLEAICKYLKENLRMRLHDIALSLHRDDRTIWLTYKHAIAKMPEALAVDETSRMIPVHVIANRKLSVLESIVTYLRSLKLRYSEIGKLLSRNERNIWTVNKRAERKLHVK